MLTGPNGAGKTNLIEAVSLLTPGRGLRRARLEDLSRQGGGPWTVFGRLGGDDPITVASALSPETGRRVVKADGRTLAGPAGLADYLACVWLTPQTDRLFLDQASVRRRFLDRLVFSADPAHARELGRYERYLRERTKILRLHRADRSWLGAVEAQIAASGVAIAAARIDITAALNRLAVELETGFPRPVLKLVGAIENRLTSAPALAVEEWFQSQLETGRDRDADQGGAGVGPHRSDLDVFDPEMEQSAAALSTGRQKALLIAIVLTECRLHAARRGRMPLLLLDEIGAHLDRQRREQLFGQLIDLRAQAWLTGTEREWFEPLGHAAQRFTVEAAEVSPDD